jgi:hypothetical protein
MNTTKSTRITSLMLAALMTSAILAGLNGLALNGLSDEALLAQNTAPAAASAPVKL